MQTFKQFLHEVAASDEIKSEYWYHGTTLENAEKIIKDGFIKPSEIVKKTTKTKMAPIHNRVYLTNRIEEALDYALMRSGYSLNYPSHEGKNSKPSSAIIVIESSELKDVIPDEDIIADLIPNYVSNKDENGIHKAQWLIDLAKKHTPKAYQAYTGRGDYDLGTKLGKMLIKYLSDDQKLKLIGHGRKMAHEGPIKIKEVWKIDNFQRDKLAKKPQDFRNYGEQIYPENLNESTLPKKLIVYHGTASKFTRFDPKMGAQGLIWFTSNKDKILNGTVGAQGKGYIITAEVTINNPAGWEEYHRLGLWELQREGFDGAILPDEDGKGNFDCFVFKASQVKILKNEKV